MSRQHGFTLIEAIVALVLIATTGMALFSWINSNIMTLNRVQLTNAENAATSNILDYMNTVNPMATPDGTARLGAYSIDWKSVAIVDLRDGAGYPYGVSLYQFGLYQTKITIKKTSGEFWFALNLQQVGFKRVRDTARPF